MATAPLGSTARTNQLLQEASSQTHIAAPTFGAGGAATGPAGTMSAADIASDRAAYRSAHGGTTATDTSQPSTPTGAVGGAPSAEQQQAETKALQDYLVQHGALTSQQVATGPGIYGPQTTAAAAQLYQKAGVNVPTKQEIQTMSPESLAAKYQGVFQAVQGTQAPDSQGLAAATINAQTQPSTDPVFNALSASTAPIMQSLNQVLQNINDPNLTATSLQSEYNNLQQQYNLPSMQAQLLNMQNVMNGTPDDIRNEINKAGGTATESQVMGMASARNTVILKQYNALATQYQAAQSNVQNLMQYAATDQATALQRQQATAGIVESMASIQMQMTSMGMTMQQNAATNLNKIVTNVGYSGLAAQAAGNPAVLGYYENMLGLAQGSLSDPSTLSQLETLRQISLGVTPQQAAVNTGTGTQTSSPVSAAVAAIGQFESGGSYTAISPKNTSGDYSYGKYQVLGSNIPSWTKEATGQALTPQEFLQNQQAQDATAQYMVGKYWNQYGNIQDVASMWFTGKPASQSGGLKDVTGTTSEQYISQVGSLFGKYSMSPYGAMGTSYTQPTDPSNPAPQSGGSLLSATGLSLQEFNYLTQGVTSMSRLPVQQRNQIMAGATQWLNSHGIDISTFQSRYQAYNTVLSGNIQRTNAAQIQENELLGTISNLSSTINQADLSQLKPANVAKLFAGQQVNDPMVTKYGTYLLSLRNELAGYNAAARGNLSASGGPSPDQSDMEEAAQVLQNGLSSGSLTGFQQAVTSQQQKMATVLQGSVDSANKQVWSLFGVADKYQSPVQQGSKGTMSDSSFVEKTLDNMGLSYQSALAQVPPGKIGVIDNSSGQVGVLDDISEFDPSKYTKL